MKRRRILAVFLAALVLAGGCGEQGREASAEVSPGGETEAENTEKKEPETYTFVDVEGNSYETELLEQAERCPWDYSRLTREGEFLYYRDKEGNPSSRLGVDVSRYQGNVDWQQVKSAGVEFVILRLGFRGYGEEGRLVLDEFYEQNLSQAEAAGLDCGVYFFSQAITEEEALEEAEFVLAHLPETGITGPVVFDTEEIKEDGARTAGLDKEAYTRHCQVFCDRIREAGYQPMIYANMKWMAFTLDMEKLEDYEKWYADYEELPQCPYRFTIWQYTETGSVPGIEGNVDLNIWFYEEDQ